MHSGDDVRTPDTMPSDDTHHGTDDRYYIIPPVLLVYSMPTHLLSDGVVPSDDTTSTTAKLCTPLPGMHSGTSSPWSSAKRGAVRVLMRVLTSCR